MSVSCFADARKLEATVGLFVFMFGVEVYVLVFSEESSSLFHLRTVKTK